MICGIAQARCGCTFRIDSSEAVLCVAGWRLPLRDSVRAWRLAGELLDCRHIPAAHLCQTLDSVRSPPQLTAPSLAHRAQLAWSAPAVQRCHLTGVRWLCRRCSSPACHQAMLCARCFVPAISLLPYRQGRVCRELSRAISPSRPVLRAAEGRRTDPTLPSASSVPRLRPQPPHPPRPCLVIYCHDDERLARRKAAATCAMVNLTQKCCVLTCRPRPYLQRG